MSKETLTTISQTIRQAILEGEKSAYQIAKETGISKGVLSRFINEKRDIRLGTADKIASCLELNLVQKESI